MISRPGNVDAGDTVMDYLRQERERGITITSATIAFPWLNNYRINLIDTPGHVDFTMEVERSLRVLDGAVAIIDGISGVEAQTETVWLQSNQYHLPRLIFINKLDRDAFALKDIFSQIKSRLACSNAHPVQKAFFEIVNLSNLTNSSFVASPWIIDLVTLELVYWSELGSSKFSKLPFQTWSKDPFFTKNACAPLDNILSERVSLLEIISEKDDTLLETYLDNSSQTEKIPSTLILESVRSATIRGNFVPILYGAALKNWGIQPLLDAVIRYLPSPQYNSKLFNQEGGIIGAALVFKVVVDEQKGPMAFVRVYQGLLKPKKVVINTTKGIKERISKILHMTSDDSHEIPYVSFGNFAVITGLKATATGDTLIFPESESLFISQLRSSVDASYVLPGLKIPSPVYFRSIDTENASAEDTLVQVLKKLELEDPSFKFEKNLESGQMLISGMGELHLEILSDKIINDFKCKVKLGQMNIAYKESISGSFALPVHIQKTINNELLCKRMHAGISLTISPKFTNTPSIETERIENIITIENNFISEDSLNCIPTTTIEELEGLITEHVSLSLSNGPIAGFPCIGLVLNIHSLFLFPDSTISSIRAIISDTIKEFLNKKAIFSLYEPVMTVKIRTPKECMGIIISDINALCRGSVLSITDEIAETNSTEPPQYSHIDAEIPLASMSGYSSHLRSISSGAASFNMVIKGYSECPQNVMEDLKKKGFYN